MMCRKRLRHLPADAHADRRVATRARIVEIPAQPAIALELFGVAGRLPNLGRTKMRTIRIGISGALNDAQATGVVQVLESGKVWVQSQIIAELQHLLGGETQSRTRPVIMVVGERDNRVEP